MTPPISPGPPVAATPARSLNAAPAASHRPGDQAVEVQQMGARRDLRDDAAERPVLVFLRQHQVGEDAAVAGDHRRRRLVAAGLDAEHDHA